MLENRKGHELKRDAYVSLGQPEPVVDPKDVVLEETLTDWMTTLMTRRLIEDDHNVALISDRDYPQLLPHLEEYALQDDALSEDEKRSFAIAMKSVFGTILELMNENLLERDPYDHFHRLVETILDLAKEYDVSPEDLLTTEHIKDEICRRSYSRAELLKKLALREQRIASPDRFMKNIMDPILGSLDGGDDEDRDAFVSMTRAQIEPQIRDMCERLAPFMKTRNQADFERVFPSA